MSTPGKVRGSTTIDAQTQTPFERTELAGWGLRFGAWILDALMIIGIPGILFLIFLLVEPNSAADIKAIENDTEPSNIFFIGLGVALLIWIPLCFAWEIIWPLTKIQGKPAQVLLGFRIANLQGERISTGQSVGRFFSKWLYGLSLIGTGLHIATAFTIGLSGRRQAIHDMMPNTICVRKEALDRFIGRQQAALGIQPPPPSGSLPITTGPPPPVSPISLP